jgi:multidrug efflux pump subunit AcrB
MLRERGDTYDVLGSVLAAPVASAKVLLLPLGIAGFVVFLLLLGALALGSALGLIWLIGWVVRAPMRLTARWQSRRAARES